MKKIGIVLVLIVTICLMVAGCAQLPAEEVEPTPTPIPTPAPAPTETLPPIETPPPAEEAELPPTPAPMPGPMPAPTLAPQPRPFPRPTDILLYGLGERPLDPQVLSQTHATIIAVGTEADRPQEEDELRRMVAIAHKLGLRYTASISTFDLFGDGRIPNRPDLLEATCVDIDGQKMIWEWEEGRDWQCTNNPIWQEFLLETAKRNVDCRADGILIDEWQGSATVQDMRFNGCFCGYCMQGFREYLKEKYSSQELESFGIKDIDSFDYGDFIRGGYLAQYKSGERWQVPLFRDFQDYQMKTILNFWHEFISELRAYAAAQGKDIYFSANTPELNPEWIPIADELDYLLLEWTFAYPPNGRSIPAYLVARGLGKLAVLGPSTAQASLLSRRDLTTLMKIYTAEAYSAGGFLYVPYELSGRTPEGWQWCSANIEELSPYYDFIHNNGLYYENLASTSRIAVLYSYPSARWDYDPFAANFYGISNLLLDAHFQYDVLFAGDDDWIEDKLTLEALSRYEVVILPNTRNLSDRQVNLLLSYVESGGHLIGFGDIGSRDEKDHQVQRAQLKALLVKGWHSYGQGQFVYMQGERGWVYLTSKNASAREEFAEQLRGLIYPNIQTDANENVAMLEYWNGETGSIVIHLINYAYDIDTQRLSPQENIDLEVLLYEELLGKDLVVYYSSPDWTGVEELDYEVCEGRVKFRIPKLDFYGVVSIGQRHNSK